MTEQTREYLKDRLTEPVTFRRAGGNSPRTNLTRTLAEWLEIANDEAGRCGRIAYEVTTAGDVEDESLVPATPIFCADALCGEGNYRLTDPGVLDAICASFEAQGKTDETWRVIC